MSGEEWHPEMLTCQAETRAECNNDAHWLPVPSEATEAGEACHRGYPYCDGRRPCACPCHDPAEPDAGAVEVLVKVLIEEGAGVGSSIHGWRCEYPDRYGPCDCVDETARAILASDWLAALLDRVRREAKAEALREAADALPAATEGTDRAGTETWRAMDRDIYSLAIEEAQAALRDRAARIARSTP